METRDDVVVVGDVGLADPLVKYAAAIKAIENGRIVGDSAREPVASAIESEVRILAERLRPLFESQARAMRLRALLYEGMPKVKVGEARIGTRDATQGMSIEDDPVALERGRLKRELDEAEKQLALELSDRREVLDAFLFWKGQPQASPTTDR